MAFQVNLADFEMHRTLGCGSFGRVKYAKYKQDNKWYAVKFMKKHEIIKLKQVDHINNEKRLMAQISHPFVVNMTGYAKDDHYVYIVMESITGGELFTHLRRARKFSDDQAKFYGLQVGAAFAHCHGKNIIHRDLKPENILLCPNGYSKLTDFGFAKIIEPGTRTYTLCGTPEYIAPEVLLNKGHGKPVDWWTLGILIYEMICGQPPFCDEDPMGIYQKILAGKVYFPKYFDKNSKALVKKLLVADLSKRYGNLKDGPADIISHKWFASCRLTVSSNEISLLTVVVNNKNNSKTISKQQNEKTDREEMLLEPTVDRLQRPDGVVLKKLPHHGAPSGGTLNNLFLQLSLTSLSLLSWLWLSLPICGTRDMQCTQSQMPLAPTRRKEHIGSAASNQGLHCALYDIFPRPGFEEARSLRGTS
ncbi:unnamed protein product [Polarella glacialis]|uniref:Protein kinase domain-containing protein n=1 Tax=Polarella glacialis TaxID=89957 RepID=A0A813FLF9_POLGL|nr:unnamed protein product [Polarella glacialis]